MFAVSPTVTKFQGYTGCGESVFDELTQNDYQHFYELNINEPGWKIATIHICITNIATRLALRQNNAVKSYIAKDRDRTSDPLDKDCELYRKEKRVITMLPLSEGKYLIEIMYDGNPHELLTRQAEYELRVSCQTPLDTYEILRPLPLSSWSWSDVFDDPNCKNPANISWCAKDSFNAYSFVQVDLGAQFIIYQINTFTWEWGYFPLDVNEWVISYNLEYSGDGISFRPYVTNTTLFYGRWEWLLDPSVTAKYLRFIPVDFHNAKRMGINALGRSYVVVYIYGLHPSSLQICHK